MIGHLRLCDRKLVALWQMISYFLTNGFLIDAIGMAEKFYPLDWVLASRSHFLQPYSQLPTLPLNAATSPIFKPGNCPDATAFSMSSAMELASSPCKYSS